MRSFERYFGRGRVGDAFDTLRRFFMKSTRFGTGISAPFFVRCVFFDSVLPFFMSGV